MEIHTFRGGPAEVGGAQALVDLEYVKNALAEKMAQPHDLQHPYFRGNLEFMRREFPDYVEQIEGFGDAAGIEDFDEMYYLHLLHTGGEDAAYQKRIAGKFDAEPEGCSSLAIMLDKDGPGMLRTYDPSGPESNERLLKELYLGVFPDCKPHAFVGVGWRLGIQVLTSINDAGLMIGGASGHQKYNWPDKVEHLNLYFVIHLLTLHCADCGDVRHFLNQYRISGIKGITGTAIDAKGNMVGFELESENIALREPQDGMVLETNHWQHPDLQNPSRAAAPEFWSSPYYYNSQNRVHYLEYHRESFKQMETIDELVDFSFDVHAPGRLLQVEAYNVANWITSHAIFATSRDRKMRVHTYPLDKQTYVEVALPA